MHLHHPCAGSTSGFNAETMDLSPGDGDHGGRAAAPAQLAQRAPTMPPDSCRGTAAWRSQQRHRQPRVDIVVGGRRAHARSRLPGRRAAAVPRGLLRPPRRSARRRRCRAASWACARAWARVSLRLVLRGGGGAAIAEHGGAITTASASAIGAASWRAPVLRSRSGSPRGEFIGGVALDAEAFSLQKSASAISERVQGGDVFCRCTSGSSWGFDPRWGS